jgi:putative thioredoxin
MPEYSVEVTQETFAQAVIQRSHEVPVLVDFWAPWCGPCRALTPILHKLAGDYGGKFILATVNTDDNQRLAYDFNIRGIPAVKLFRQGQVVEEFTGAYPESAIRVLLDRHVSRASDTALHDAQVLRKQGKRAEAAALLTRALADDPGNDRLHPALADDLLALHRHDEAESLLRQLPVARQEDDDVDKCFIRIKYGKLAHGSPPIAELTQRTAAEPSNCQVRYQLGARLIASGNYAAALEHLLEIVRRDRQFEGDAGRKGLLDVFKLLGPDDPLVPKYRGLLATALH